MIDAAELRRWVETLDPDAQVGIDDGGLILEVADSEACLEIGGMPVWEDYDDIAVAKEPEDTGRLFQLPAEPELGAGIDPASIPPRRLLLDIVAEQYRLDKEAADEDGRLGEDLIVYEIRRTRLVTERFRVEATDETLAVQQLDGDGSQVEQLGLDTLYSNIDSVEVK